MSSERMFRAGKPPVLELSPVERASPEIAKVRAYLLDLVGYLRVMNDNSLDGEATARLRGRIAEAKRLLKFVTDDGTMDLDLGDGTLDEGTRTQD